VITYNDSNTFVWTFRDVSWCALEPIQSVNRWILLRSVNIFSFQFHTDFWGTPRLCFWCRLSNSPLWVSQVRLVGRGGGERADFSQAMILLEVTFQLLRFFSTVLVGIQCFITQGNMTIHPFKHYSKRGSKRSHGWQLLTWSFQGKRVSCQVFSHTTRC
jgi:hypothetical protein